VARRIRNTKLDTRSARTRLAQRREPYWAPITGGLALGYRKGSTGGSWIARHYSAEQGRRYHALGAADDVLDADGRSVLTFDQAQDRTRRWLVTAGVEGEAPRGPYTVNDACDDYLEFLHTDGRTAGAIRDAGYRVDAFIRPTLGTLKVSALEAKQLRRWLANLAKAAPRLRTRQGETQRHKDQANDRARKASANRVLTTLKAALNFAFDEGRAPSNREWGRRVAPYENVETARVRYLHLAEATRLVNACTAEFRSMVTAALMTGARYSELARLKVADFDADAGTVFVELSKGGKARHVVLSAEGVKFFAQVCAGRAGTELIFRRPDGGQWLKSHQARPMRDACKRARIAPAIGFHMLRHSYATALVKNGAPLHVVAKNLGHVTKDGQPDVRMVTKHYAHLEESFIANTIRKHAPRFGFALGKSKVVAIGGQ
jgi:integrase